MSTNLPRRLAALAAAGVLCALPAAALAGPHKVRRPRRPVRQVSTVLSSRHTKRGVVITTAAGMALYTFTGRSCGAGCQRVWHPLIARGRLVAARGSRLDARLLGRVRDGRAYQVTYDHHRLYTFVGDHKPGQIAGEGKHQFGGYWYVVGLRGAILRPRKGKFCSGVCGLY